MLHMPRLELLLFMMVLPMLVAAGATLLRGPGAGYVAAGVGFAVLLPVGFLAVSLALVVHYLVRNSVERRRAVFVLRLLPGVSGGSDGSGGGDGAPAGAIACTAAGARMPASPFEQHASGPLDSSDGAIDRFFSACSTPDGSGSLTAAMLGSGSGHAHCSRGSTALSAGASGAQFIMQRTPSAAERSDVLEQPSAADGQAERAGGAPAAAAGGAPVVALRRGLLALQRYTFHPLFGFNLVSPGDGTTGGQVSVASIPVGTAADGGGPLVGQGAWLCKSKWDTSFVKRYGALFEDARGPQVYRITSVYEPVEGEGELVVWSGHKLWSGGSCCCLGRCLCLRRAVLPCRRRLPCPTLPADGRVSTAAIPAPCRHRRPRGRRRAGTRLLHLERHHCADAADLWHPAVRLQDGAVCADHQLCGVGQQRAAGEAELHGGAGWLRSKLRVGLRSAAGRRQATL